MKLLRRSIGKTALLSRFGSLCISPDPGKLYFVNLRLIGRGSVRRTSGTCESQDY